MSSQQWTPEVNASCNWCTQVEQLSSQVAADKVEIAGLQQEVTKERSQSEKLKAQLTDADAGAKVRAQMCLLLELVFGADISEVFLESSALYLREKTQ